MLVSCCGSIRSIYLSDPSQALTEQQIVDGILLNLTAAPCGDVAELVAQMFDAIEEKNFEEKPVIRCKPPTPVRHPGPILVSRLV